MIPRADSGQRRTLALACLAHALHDGYTDLIYVLLPVWQGEFALGYASVALLRGLYAGGMAVLQLAAARLASRLGAAHVLAGGTALAAAGYCLAGFSGGLAGLCFALMVSGAGASMQHPIASAAVARAYQAGSRGPLGTYNFAGDVGKAAIPATVALLLTSVPWRQTLWVVAAVGGAVALLIGMALPRPADPAGDCPDRAARTGGRSGGFALLLAIGVLDSAARMGLLVFLPFLLKLKGASTPVIGMGLALVFVGGAAGKFAFGWIGERIGVVRVVLVTELATAMAILAVLALALEPTLALLPLLGLVLNGTSSTLYGTVAEWSGPAGSERAFAWFYTGTVGSGAIAPLFFGLLGDALGPQWACVATAATAVATIPLAVALAPHFSAGR